MILTGAACDKVAPIKIIINATSCCTTGEKPMNRTELEQAANLTLELNPLYSGGNYDLTNLLNEELLGIIEYPTFEELEQKLGGFIINPNNEYEEYPDKFETYGTDLQAVLARLETHPRTVFTVQDSDCGDYMILTGGFHLCNRLYYVISQTPVPDNIDYENLCIRMCIYNDCE